MSGSQNLLFIGEAMLELTSRDNDSFGKSFAGDTYNTSVYLKRAFPDFHVHFMTALGSDPLSEEFLSRTEIEGIDTSFIGTMVKHHLGAYMVMNDSEGERTFLYWRSDSAAKSMMTALPNLDSLSEKKPMDAIFFSGITLAILHKEQRPAFWNFIKSTRELGVKIMFDPNYRPTLWQSAEDAKEQIEMAFGLSDYLLPGLDDFKSLYNLDSVQDCIEFCRSFDVQELVLKQGKDPVHIVNKDGHQIIDIKQSQKVVDTTSAGDAFNGIYLGARLQGESCERAVQMANFAASRVIETPGAIMPKPLFMQAISRW